MNKQEQEKFNKAVKSNKDLSEKIEELISKNSELEESIKSSPIDEETQGVIDGYKAELEKVSGENKDLSEKIEELESELSISKKDNATMVGSKIIMKTKDLDKDKQYITGPNGVGYVEKR